MRVVSTTSPDGLLAPSRNPHDATRRRSASLAPSLRSNAASLEEREEAAEFGNFPRRHTFKIPRKPSVWSWIKGLFDRERFMRELEETIQVVPETPSKTPGSQFMFNILVSTKVDNTQCHTTRCLLDTGCLSGNLVTRELVESLGYVDLDFQRPTPFESRGYHTLTGEHFNIEAAILLSWHHSASPVIYRRMRFLVVSSSKFEMIIGADAITRHGLLISPVFAGSDGRVTHENAEDPMVLDPNIKHAEWSSKVENDERALRKENEKPELERDTTRIKRIKGRLSWERHVLKVLNHRLDAARYRKKGDLRSAHRQEDLVKKELEAWNAENPSEKSDKSSASSAGNGTGNGMTTTAHPPVKRGSGHSK